MLTYSASKNKHCRVLRYSTRSILRSPYGLFHGLGCKYIIITKIARSD